MTPTHFLYRAATGNAIATGENICCLCGCRCRDTAPIDEVIADTFTNHGMCRVPSSKVSCLACRHYFRHRWEIEGQAYPAEYRKRSLFITQDAVTEWHRDDMRRDIESFLTHGCPQCVLVIALSKKKHCLPLAVVNESSQLFIVQLEESQVELSPASYGQVMSAFDFLRHTGCTKGEILSGVYHHSTLKKEPRKIKEIMAMDDMLKQWRPSSLLSLVSYIHIDN